MSYKEKTSVSGDYLGPYDLTAEVVNMAVKEETGNYFLTSNPPLVMYVGRSDDDLRRRLLEHVAKGKYTAWWGAHTDDVVEAYKRECIDYHFYGGSDTLDNEVHPKKPAGHTFQKCPYCKQ